MSYYFLFKTATFIRIVFKNDNVQIKIMTATILNRTATL